MSPAGGDPLGEELIASIGDNCVDISLPGEPEADADAPAATVPASGQAPAELPGGNALNVAMLLAQGGRHVAYLGAVGEDAAAEVIIEAGSSAGVDMSRVVRVPGQTGRTVVARNAHGERRFVSEDYGASAGYRLDDETVAWLAGARWLHFARQADLAQRAETLRADGTMVSCDLGYAGGIEELEALAAEIDVVFMSASAEPQLSDEQLLQRALDAGATLAVVTLGGAGSVAAAPGARWRTDAVAVASVVDTLGAGDAYIAAFIAARMDGSGVGAAMQAGARAGAAACTQWGLGSLIQTGRVPV